jgi:hypothetical protein
MIRHLTRFLEQEIINEFEKLVLEIWALVVICYLVLEISGYHRWKRSRYPDLS